MAKTLGIMLDCSRNAVMRPEKVKEFAALIQSMGYNMLQLYTEETYEVENEPFFGYMRGRYSMEEIRDIDAYCRSIGVELIPCIQTLAHLGHLNRWNDYSEHFDCMDILLVGDPRVYELIDADEHITPHHRLETVFGGDLRYLGEMLSQDLAAATVAVLGFIPPQTKEHRLVHTDM